MRFRSTSFPLGRFATMTVLATLVFAVSVSPAGAQTEGPNSPVTVVNDASFGTLPWTLPANGALSDNSYTSVTPLGNPSQYLKATDFGFSIPGAAVIDGIEVDVEKVAAGTVFDARARIVKGGTPGATDRSIVGNWPAVDTVLTYGSNSDLWGETWSAADINAAGFGFAISADDNVSAAFVDAISITVYYSLCGDNQIGLSEDCDDGNTLNGDCCSSTCEFDNIGTPCPDSTVCNGDETCDGAGECLAGTALDCDDTNQCTQDSCHPVDGCVNDGSPIGGCRSALKSILVMKNKSPDTKDKLIWKWIKGQMTNQSDFGLPTGTTQATLCIYTGTTSVLIAEVPGGPANWKPISTKGYKYKEKTGIADGITKMILKGGVANKAKVIVKGKGANLGNQLGDPDLEDLADPVTVQLVNDANGVCFSSTFNAVDFIISGDPAKFKAKDQQ